MFVFFHQNDVTDAQGGVERYVDTLLAAAGDDALLVGETPARPAPNRLGLALPRLPGPKWLPFALAVFANLRRIRAALAGAPRVVMEFSRPEYAVFAWAFAGARVFTIHGTGPGPSERVKRLVHDVACWFLPFLADRVQVVGRDTSGLSPAVVARLGARLAHVDAWYDDAFAPRPLPSGGPTVVFYAGRIVAQKNPELLFAVVEAAKRRFGDRIEFRYFGADADRITEAGLSEVFVSSGLLDARRLAAAIGECHMGLMCSHFGEGSPFIIVETLACGRPYVLSRLPTLTAAYGDNPGVRFADFSVESFLAAIEALRADLDAGLTPEAIAASVARRAKPVATRALLDELDALA